MSSRGLDGWDDGFVIMLKIDFRRDRKEFKEGDVVFVPKQLLCTP